MKAFIVHPDDNVATALQPIEPGVVTLLGGGAVGPVTALEAVAVGHKVALRGLAAGSPVVKYGIVIGSTRVAVKAGQWMHLHNFGSDFDERSNTLDVESGAPTEEDVYR